MKTATQQAALNTARGTADVSGLAAQWAENGSIEFYVPVLNGGRGKMETKITRAELFGAAIWTVSYYSHFSRKWVVAGQFDKHADACAEADSWKA